MNVLFLSAWYPNRYDAMAGLFVRKHAQAVSLYCNVKVLYVHADENITSSEIESTCENGVEEVIVYYPVSSNVFLHKLHKVIQYLIAYRKGFQYLKSKDYVPDIVHANILTRTGVIAYLYKCWKHVPYVVMEHWSRYLSQNFSYHGRLRQWATKLVVRNAGSLMTVSALLQKAMTELGLENGYSEIVHNVVDDFFAGEKTEGRTSGGKKRFLHVSCFDEKAKNVCGLLRATKMLAEKRSDFELVIVGAGMDFDSCVDYSDVLGLSPEQVRFVGEVTPEEVAGWFERSDCFVLFSNYETASVVVAESLVSGVPVVSTPVGIVPEVIHDGNGVVVASGDEVMLCEKMEWVLDHIASYDRAAIQAEAKDRFSFSGVGAQLYGIYKRVLESDRVGLN